MGALLLLLPILQSLGPKERRIHGSCVELSHSLFLFAPRISLPRKCRGLASLSDPVVAGTVHKQNTLAHVEEAASFLFFFKPFLWMVVVGGVVGRGGHGMIWDGIGIEAMIWH